jgi:hypothetical protein
MLGRPYAMGGDFRPFGLFFRGPLDQGVLAGMATSPCGSVA